MNENTDRGTEQSEIVDQSDTVRDPADDSDEMNDPTGMTATYPAAFDARIDEAAAAIEEHDPADDVRHGGGNG